MRNKKRIKRFELSNFGLMIKSYNNNYKLKNTICPICIVRVSKNLVIYIRKWKIRNNYLMLMFLMKLRLRRYKTWRRSRMIFYDKMRCGGLKGKKCGGLIKGIERQSSFTI